MESDAGLGSSFFRSYGDEDRFTAVDALFVLLGLVLALVFAGRMLEPAGAPGESRFLASVFVVGATGFLLLFLGWSTRRPEEPFARPIGPLVGIPGHAIALAWIAFLHPDATVTAALVVAGLLGVFLLVPFRIANPSVRGVEPYVVGGLILMIVPFLDSQGAIPGATLAAAVLPAVPLTAGGLHLLLDQRIPTPTIATYALATTAVIYAWAGSIRLLVADPGSVGAGPQGLDLSLVYLAPAAATAGLVSLGLTKLIERRADADTERGNRHYAKGQYEEALGAFTRALQRQPGSKVIRVCRADALAKLHKTKEAVTEYDVVLKDEPDFTPAINGKGSALRSMGEHGRALLYHQKAVLTEPRSATAWVNKGNAFYSLKEPDMALTCYEGAIEIDPGHAGAWFNYATVLMNLGRDKASTDAFQKLRQILDVQSEQAARRPAPAKGPVRHAFTRALRFPVEFLTENTLERLYTFVTYNPGESLASASLALGLDRKHLLRAAGSLRRGGLIDTRREGESIRLFPRDVKAIEIEVVEGLSEGGTIVSKRHYLSEGQQTVLEALRNVPGQKLEELAQRAKIPAAVAAFHIRVLADAGLVAGREGDSRGDVRFSIR